MGVVVSHLAKSIIRELGNFPVVHFWQWYCCTSLRFQRNTFQCVLVSDGSLSFAIFLYGEIQWVSNNNGANTALVGVNAGDGIQQFNVSGSRREAIINITTTSNIGVPGVWIFQLNGDDIPINPGSNTHSSLPSCHKPGCMNVLYTPYCSAWGALIAYPTCQHAYTINTESW